MNQFGLSSESFYRQSGKVPFFGTILFLALSVLAITVTGLVYGLVIYFIPIVQLSVFAVIGYVVVASSLLVKTITIGKLRNPFLVGLAVFGLSIYAEYIGWVAWIATFAKDTRYLIEFFFPFDIWNIIVQLGKEGVWSFDGNTPKGSFLYFIWLVEALIVIGGITYTTIGLTAKMIFCEESNMWVTKKKLLGVFSPLSNPGQTKLDVAQGNLSVFNNLTIAKGNTPRFTLLEVYECDHCNNFHVLNLDDGTLIKDRRGRVSTKTKSIVRNLIVSPAFISNLKRAIEEKRVESLQQKPQTQEMTTK